MAIPFFKIHACSEDVNNVDYLDINFSSANFYNTPKVIAIADNNINIHISNLTKTTARLNFSSKYTGTVKYTLMSKN